jgi:hypothetical protein
MKLEWNNAEIIDASLNEYRNNIKTNHNLYAEFKTITTYDLYKFVLFLLYDNYRDQIVDYTTALEFSETILRISLIIGEIDGIKNIQIYYNNFELYFLLGVSKRIISIKLSITQDSKQ